MGEEGTLRQLKAHRKELIDPKITEHRGRIVKTTGDGIRCPSGHQLVHYTCQLLGVKRTCLFAPHMSGFDAKPTLESWFVGTTGRCVYCASFPRMTAPFSRGCEFVGWTSAMMTFAGMGSFALAGIIADLFR